MVSYVPLILAMGLLRSPFAKQFVAKDFIAQLEIDLGAAVLARDKAEGGRMIQKSFLQFTIAPSRWWCVAAAVLMVDCRELGDARSVHRADLNAQRMNDLIFNSESDVGERKDIVLAKQQGHVEWKQKTRLGDWRKIQSDASDGPR